MVLPMLTGMSASDVEPGPVCSGEVRCQILIDLSGRPAMISDFRSATNVLLSPQIGGLKLKDSRDTHGECDDKGVLSDV